MVRTSVNLDCKVIEPDNTEEDVGIVLKELWIIVGFELAAVLNIIKDEVLLNWTRLRFVVSIMKQVKHFSSVILSSFCFLNQI